MNLYWITTQNPLRLAIATRPRGGDWLCDDIQSIGRSGVDILVSMLTEEEANELTLASEFSECRSANVTFLNFPIEDRSIPPLDGQFTTFVDDLVQDMKKGKSVAVHCRAGIGRSSVLTACLLVRFGASPLEAFRNIENARRCRVPDTEEQIDFVKRFAQT